MIELAAIWEAGKFAFGSYAWARKNFSKEAASVVPRVNHLINKNATCMRIFRVAKETPKIVVAGRLEDDCVGADIPSLRSALELNEYHALARKWDGSDVAELRVDVCDFAQVLTLRGEAHGNMQKMPNVVSAGAVIVCAAQRKIIVHRRSEHSATYPGDLHILGGAYHPPVQLKKIDIPGDRMSLEYTMIREVFEESGLIVRRYDEPVCVAQELDTGFVQYIYLGVRIASAQCDSVQSNMEGDIVSIGFDDIPQQLADAQGWVPTGRGHILTWLGLGAPGAGWNARFDGKSAKEVFDQIVKD